MACESIRAEATRRGVTYSRVQRERATALNQSDKRSVEGLDGIVRPVLNQSDKRDRDEMILHLFEQGLTVREIAGKTGCSPDTAARVTRERRRASWHDRWVAHETEIWTAVREDPDSNPEWVAEAKWRLGYLKAGEIPPYVGWDPPFPWQPVAGR